MGLITNGLSFSVFAWKIKTKGGSPANFYFMSLAIADGLYVSTINLVYFLYALDPPISLHWLTNCYVIGLFGPNPTATMSGLLILVITVDRFLVTYFPFKAKSWNTNRRGVITIGILMVIVYGVNWQVFGGIKPIPETELKHFWFPGLHCRGKTSFIDDYHMHWYPWIDLMLTFFIPGAPILIFNALIILKIRKVASAKMKDSTTKLDIPRTSSTSNTETAQEKGDQIVTKHEVRSKQNPQKVHLPASVLDRHSTRLTLLCLMMSFTFLLLLAPDSILKLLIYMEVAPELKVPMEVTIVLEIMISICHTVNFFFYCLMAPSFRKNMRTCLRCIK